jgi:uncharacterized protein with GYD domain
MGDHDMVALVEAPNDDTIAKFVLGVASAGNIRTKTLKAFSEKDYRSIISSLS